MRLDELDWEDAQIRPDEVRRATIYTERREEFRIYHVIHKGTYHIFRSIDIHAEYPEMDAFTAQCVLNELLKGVTDEHS